MKFALLLCFLTSKRVLCTPFTGQNHLFQPFNHLPTAVHDRIGAVPFTMQIKMPNPDCPSHPIKIPRYWNLRTCEKADQVFCLNSFFISGYKFDDWNRWPKSDGYLCRSSQDCSWIDQNFLCQREILGQQPNVICTITHTPPSSGFSNNQSLTPQTKLKL